MLVFIIINFPRWMAGNEKFIQKLPSKKRDAIFCVYLNMGKWWNQGCHGRSQLFPSCNAFSFNWATKKKFAHVCGIIWDIKLNIWHLHWGNEHSISLSLPPPHCYDYLFTELFIRNLFIVCRYHVLLPFSSSPRLTHNVISSATQIQKAFFRSCQAVKSDEDVSRTSRKLILKAL